ncbi:MAG: acyltransferase family protein [Acutalibacteraceae bacterium]
MKSKRIVWIDLYKSIGFFFVIIGHLEAPRPLVLWIYSFHMPLFLLATGFTFNFEKAYNTKFKDFLWTRFKKLIIPYFWMQMMSLSILYLRRLILGGKIPDFTDYLCATFVSNTEINRFSPCPALYYIVLLFFAEIGFYAVIKISKCDKRMMFAVLFSLLPLSLLTRGKDVIMHLNVVPVAMMLIFIGKIMMELYKGGFKEKLEALSSARYAVICVGLLALGIALAFLNGRSSIHTNKYGKDFTLYILCALITNIAVAMISMKAVKLLSPNSIFIYIGQSTLFYMGLHSQIKNVLEQIARKFTDIESAPFLIAATLILYFGLIPLSKITDKYFPFVAGRSTINQDKKTDICQTFMTVFASFPLYYVSAAHLAQALFPAVLSGVMTKAVYFVAGALIWTVLCYFGCIVVRKFLPVVFLIEKPKQALKNGGDMIKT